VFMGFDPRADRSLCSFLGREPASGTQRRPALPEEDRPSLVSNSGGQSVWSRMPSWIARLRRATLVPTSKPATRYFSRMRLR